MAELLAILIVMGMAMVFVLAVGAALAALVFPIFGKLIRPVIVALWAHRELKGFREDPKGTAKAHLDRRIQAEAKRRRDRAKSRRSRSRSR